MGKEAHRPADASPRDILGKTRHAEFLKMSLQVSIIPGFGSVSQHFLL